MYRELRRHTADGVRGGTMAEKVYWDSDGITVTSAKLVYDKATYPIGTLRSVTDGGPPPAEVPGRFMFRSLLLIAGGIVASFVLSVMSSLLDLPRFGGIVFLGSFVAAVVLYQNEVTLAKRRASQYRQVEIMLNSGKSLSVVGLVEKAEELRVALSSAISSINASSTSSVAEELAQLAILRDKGVLTVDDWERAKSLFLGKPRDQQDAAIAQLRKLHELQRDGVLSESEFNMKKWDVLSRGE